MSGRKDGPSGKPMLHFVQCKSKSAAEDAARSAGKGNKPVHDTAHKPGQNSHYHATDKNGERIDNGSHYIYPNKYQSPK